MHTSGDVVGLDHIVLRRTLGEVLAPLDGEWLSQTLCIEERDLELVAGIGRRHSVEECWLMVIEE